ncbi:MAG: hypothetical protein P4L46_24550 [Fimbriimonas sp.]|nr:hypothetical protein [Fimbriimonas sp.]
MRDLRKQLSLSTVCVLLGAATLQAGIQQPAQTPRARAGDLLVSPMRIVFEGPKRTAEISLLNIGDKPSLYRISLIHERMNEDGDLVNVATPGADDRFADDLVRFTPRQVLLAPRVSQVVRIQLRLPADLATGEYRSHMLFRAVSADSAPDQAPAAADLPKGLTVQIKPIFGLSIPVIVRHGETYASADFAEVRLVSTPDGLPVLVGKLTHTGNASVYGDLVVEFAQNGQPFKTLARTNGVAIYASNATRSFAVLVSQDKTLQLHNGTIRATYKHSDADGGQPFAKTQVTVL